MTRVDPAGKPGSVATVAVRFVAATILYAAALFTAAGTLAWPAAWAYLAIVLALLMVYTAIVSVRHPDLAGERTKPPADAKRWDRPFVAAIGVVLPFAFLIAAGLDHRFGWTPPMGAWAVIVGLLLVLAAGAFTTTAVAVNRFFSAVVRIQRERGHRVVDSGPYRFVRHPAYIASIVQMFGAGFALGSAAGLAVAFVAGALIVWRTALEDRTLCAELDGYADYARRVRFRLVPGVW